MTSAARATTHRYRSGVCCAAAWAVMAVSLSRPMNGPERNAEGGSVFCWFNVVYYIYRISSVEKHMTRCYRIHARRRNCFEPPRTLVGRRTRTDRDGICPPPRDSPIDPSQIESPWRVSNLGPLDFESSALPTELSNRGFFCVQSRLLSHKPTVRTHH